MRRRRAEEGGSGPRGRPHVRSRAAMSRQETLSATEDDLDPARGPSLSIVVTLFDEAGTLEELHRRLTAALEAVDRSYEVLYVDDGSTDGSFAILERLHADAPHTPPFPPTR